MEENVTNEEMEVIEESNKEVIDFGPTVNLEYFSFLSSIQKEEVYLHSKFTLMRPMKCLLGFLDNPHGSVKLYQGTLTRVSINILHILCVQILIFTLVVSLFA